MSPLARLTHASPLPHAPRSLLLCCATLLAFARAALAQSAPPVATEIVAQLTPIAPPPDGAGDLLKLVVTIHARDARRLLDSVQVTILDEDVGRPIGSAYTSPQGRAEFVVPFRGNYTIRTCHPAFLTASAEVLDCGVEPLHLCIDGFDFVTYESAVDSLRSDHLLKTELYLDRLEVGHAVPLDRVRYDYGAATLRPYSRRALDRLVTTLNHLPNLQVEVRNYTDARGDAAANLALSTARAETVAAYLIAQGMDEGRIAVRGFGESQPVNGCTDGVDCTEREHRQNRRTEVVIRAFAPERCAGQL